jgi:ABC-2 type transport system permease protein
VSFDLDHIPLAIIDQDGSKASRTLTRRLVSGQDFRQESRPATPEEAYEDFRRGEVVAAVVIPRDFERDSRRGRGAEVQVLIDGADDNTARQTQARLEGMIPAIAAGDLSGPTAGAAPPGSGQRRFDVRSRTLFNPEGRSALFLVPGLTALVLTIVAVVLTALAVAREWEEGSMAQLFATPVGRMEIVLGKLLPYLAIGALAVLLVVTASMYAFELPFRGPVWVFGLASLLFLLGALGQGLLISIVTKNQMVATQAAALSSMLPSMLLSGFIFPIGNMPTVLQGLTYIIPARYYIACLRGVLLRGNGAGVLAPELLTLTAFAAVMLALSVGRFRRRLA